MRIRAALVVVAAVTLLAAFVVAPATAAHTQLTWHQSDENDGDGPVASFAYGSLGDTPIPGDWDGDGTPTVGVVRPLANGHWRWILKDQNSAGVNVYDLEYGNWTLGDYPVQGDWDGDTDGGVGVVRPLDSGRWEWHLKRVLTPGAPDPPVFEYGSWTLGDQPISGDWEGNPNLSEVAGSSPGVVRPLANGHLRWLLREENTAGAANAGDFEYGNWELGDVPVPGNWDGRGPADDADVHTAGVARPLDNGHWKWLLKNDNAAGGPSPDPASYEFGNWELGDYPVAGDWDGSGFVQAGGTAGVVRPPQ